jgi:hypothetical protein
MLELKLEAARACWLRRACCEAPYTAVSRHCSPVTQSRLNVWQRIAPGMQGHSSSQGGRGEAQPQPRQLLLRPCCSGEVVLVASLAALSAVRLA